MPAAIGGNLTIIFDTGISSVTMFDTTITTSGGQISDVSANDGTTYTGTFVLNSGYAIDTIVYGDGGAGCTLSGYTENNFSLVAGVGGIYGTLTITTKEAINPYSIKIKNKEGIKLLTKDKTIEFTDDVKITVDESLLGGEGGTNISSLKFKEGVYNNCIYYSSEDYSTTTYQSTGANVTTLRNGQLYLVKVGKNNNGKFIPDFFEHYNSTTELYVAVSSLMSSNGCVLNLIYLNGDSIVANGTMSVSTSWVITTQPNYVPNSARAFVELEGNIYVICPTSSTSNDVSNTSDGTCNTSNYSTSYGILYPFKIEYEKLFSDINNLVKAVSNLDENGVNTLYEGEINTEQSSRLTTLNYYVYKTLWYFRTSGWDFNMLSSRKFEESDLPFIYFYTSSGGGGSD